MEDPKALSQAHSCDSAFVYVMSTNHESAIVMANMALEESQEHEIEQMRQWREELYPRG